MRKISDYLGDEEIKSAIQNLAKNHQSLFEHSNQENYILTEEIAEYCKKVNDFFTFIDDISLQCGRHDLQFSDLDIKKEIIDLLKKIDTCLKKTKIKSYEDKTVFVLYKDAWDTLVDYKNKSNTIDLLDVVEKANKLNKLFLANKEVVNSNNDNVIINFSVIMKDILDKLIKQNDHRNGKFLNNYFFNNFYLIYELSALNAKKTDISIKKMDEFTRKKLQDKINDLSKNADDITPIAQFISEQKKFLGDGIKSDIYNLSEEK